MKELSPYRIMWIFVFFDLPTETSKDRKEYTRFLKCLKKDGYIRMQYSVYMRHCISKEVLESRLKYLRSVLPKLGYVAVMQVTEKQYSKMEHFWGVEKTKPPDEPQQLQMF